MSHCVNLNIASVKLRGLLSEKLEYNNICGNSDTSLSLKHTCSVHVGVVNGKYVFINLY